MCSSASPIKQCWCDAMRNLLVIAVVHHVDVVARCWGVEDVGKAAISPTHDGGVNISFWSWLCHYDGMGW